MNKKVAATSRRPAVRRKKSVAKNATSGIRRKRSEQTNIKKKRRIRKRGRQVVYGITFLLAVISLFGAFVALTRLQDQRIVEFSINTDGTSLESANIQMIIDEVLDGMHLLYIPKDSTVVVSKRAIRSDILDMYPQIDLVDIKRIGLRGLDIVVSDHETHSLWCQEIPQKKELDARKECLMVNRSGLLFKLQRGKSREDVLVISGLDADQRKIGEHLLPTAEYDALTNFVSHVEGSVSSVNSVRFTSLSDAILGVEGGFYIHINRSNDLEKVWENFLQIWQSDDFKEERSAGSQLEYVDVRFGTNGSKAVYKFKDES